jgi:hypothetical protein
MLHQIMALFVVVSAGQAGAKPPKVVPQAAPVARLLACQSLTDAVGRLACFDHEAAAMRGAISRRDLVVVDRDEIRRTRRSLFGLSLPNMAVLGGDKEEISHIDSVLEGTSHNRDGGYVFRLEDDSRWTQVDDRPFALEPRKGEKVVVKRAAMGSFMLTVGHQPGVRVQRLN